MRKKQEPPNFQNRSETFGFFFAGTVDFLAETVRQYWYFSRRDLSKAYAAGRWNTVNDSDFGDYIWGFEYVTAGDDRVREGHRVLEGVRLPKEDPFWKKYFPPNGWNCRCTTLEIWKDEPIAKIDFGITGRDPRKRTSDAMNVPKEFRGNVGIFATPKISSSALKIRQKL
ncbi:MAG: minor capsid protein [Thermoguttaceae bacterium]|nr:minor capsid protein [Thermoguttaceae bacterium]